MPRGVYIDAEDTLLARLRRRIAPLNKPVLNVGAAQNSHPSTDENVLKDAIETMGGSGGTGSYYVVGILGFTRSVTISSSGTSYMSVANAADAGRVIIDYRAVQNGNTQWGTLDLTLLDDGSTVEVRHTKAIPNGEAGVGVNFTGSTGGSPTLHIILTITGTGATGDITFKCTGRTVPV